MLSASPAQGPDSDCLLPVRLLTNGASWLEEKRVASEALRRIGAQKKKFNSHALMPDQRMTPKGVVVRSRKVPNGIPGCEVEDVLKRFDDLPVTSHR